MTRVHILATPYVSVSTLFGLYDVLKSVGQAWEIFVSEETPHARFDVRIVAQTTDPFRCPSGILIEPHFGLQEAPPTDLLIVPGMIVSSRQGLPRGEEAVFGWLTAQAGSGIRVMAACTGALYLAEAGLLDGEEATTNWAFGDLFRREFPKVRLRLEHSLSFRDPQVGVVTSGGTSAWQELVLFVIANYAGIKQATRTAKFFQLGDMSVLQKPFMAMVPNIPHGDGVISAAQAWVAEHYALPNPVREMTLRAGLPATTFARRFRQATGLSPQDYVLSVRVEEAKQILETTDDAIDAVGREVGYEDPASFRRLFKRKAGLSPTEHRRMFGRPRFERYVAPKPPT